MKFLLATIAAVFAFAAPTFADPHVAFGGAFSSSEAAGGVGGFTGSATNGFIGVASGFSTAEQGSGAFNESYSDVEADGYNGEDADSVVNTGSLSEQYSDGTAYNAGISLGFANTLGGSGFVGGSGAGGGAFGFGFSVED